MIGVPVDVPHKMGGAIRALRLLDRELFGALKVRIRNWHLLAALWARRFVDGARHVLLLPVASREFEQRLRSPPAA